jgi:hypothetical protein
VTVDPRRVRSVERVSCGRAEGARTGRFGKLQTGVCCMREELRRMGGLEGSGTACRGSMVRPGAATKVVAKAVVVSDVVI